MRFKRSGLPIEVENSSGDHHAFFMPIFAFPFLTYFQFSKPFYYERPIKARSCMRRNASIVVSKPVAKSTCHYLVHIYVLLPVFFPDFVYVIHFPFPRRSPRIPLHRTIQILPVAPNQQAWYTCQYLT